MLEFQTEANDLLQALSLANNTIEKSSFSTILANVKLDLAGENLTITATNQNTTLQQTITVAAKSAGSITINLHTLISIIRKVIPQRVTIKSDADTRRLLLITKTCRFKLSTLPSDKFPRTEDISTAQIKFVIDCDTLIRMLRHTIFAVSTNETRYNLMGICLDVNTAHNNLAAIATDGYRMAIFRNSAELQFSQIQDLKITLPHKTAQELLKILQNKSLTSANPIISINEKHIQLECDRLVFHSRLIDAKFPDYQQLIPQDLAVKLFIDIETFSQAIERVMTIIIDRSRAICLKITSEALHIEAYGEGRGEAVESITADFSIYKYEGDAITISFNPTYIMDILHTLKQGQLIMQIKNDHSPVIITAKELANAIFAVMPIKSLNVTRP